MGRKAGQRNGKICSSCGIRKSMNAGKTNGKTYYKSECSTCRTHKNLGDKRFQTHCDSCLNEFHPVCLDVDHIDGNSKNEEHDNLQILCSNCHRLKTHLNRETTTHKYRRKND
jgi:hypothetical protein